VTLVTSWKCTTGAATLLSVPANVCSEVNRTTRQGRSLLSTKRPNLCFFQYPLHGVDKKHQSSNIQGNGVRPQAELHEIHLSIDITLLQLLSQLNDPNPLRGMLNGRAGTKRSARAPRTSAIPNTPLRMYRLDGAEARTTSLYAYTTIGPGALTTENGSVAFK